MNPRIVEMIDAENARLGRTGQSPIHAESGPLIKAAILGNFLILLELTLATHPTLPKKEQHMLRESLQFVFSAFEMRDVLESPEFEQAVKTLKKDYLDALSEF